MAEPIERNAQPITVYNVNSEACTSMENPAIGATLSVNSDANQNAKRLLPYDSGASANLVSLPVIGGGVSLGVTFETDTYLESLKVYMVFNGLTSDFSFIGWGDDTTPLAAPIRLGFSTVSDFNALIPPEHYNLQFTNMVELMQWGNMEFIQDGANYNVKITRTFDPPLLLCTEGGTEVPLIQIDIPESVFSTGSSGTLNSGGSTVMFFKGRVRTDQEFVPIPFIVPMID